MYNLADITVIKSLLRRYGFSFSKSFGQNFIIDDEICPRIVSHSGVHKNAGVIEIGAGIGVLTAELAKNAAKVLTFELDERLLPILDETLSDFDNVKIINEDILKADINALIEEHFEGLPVYVCANLPYYITSPIIMKFLEERAKVLRMTFMVQKEAAVRLCAEVGSKDTGAVSVAVSYYSAAKRLFFVPRTAFLPPPKVDSEVISLDVLKEAPIALADEAFFFALVKAAFAQRRKTAQNSISSGLNIEKTQIAKALNEMGLDESIRAERLTLTEFAELANILYNEN